MADGRKFSATLAPRRAPGDVISTTEEFVAWAKSKPGRVVISGDDEVAEVVALIDRLSLVVLTGAREHTPEEMGRATSETTGAQSVATEAIKRLRSNATFDMHAAGMRWADICDVLGVKRARADQILKNVSGGRWQETRAGANSDVERVTKGRSETV